MDDNTKSSGGKSRVDRRQILAGGVAGAASWLAGSGEARSQPVGEWRVTPLSRRGDGAPQPIHDTPLKQRARHDYRASLSPYGGRLSNPIEQLFHTARNAGDPQFDVVVIGSGYGAAVCAARLAARLHSGRRLAVIERGREWVPGTFPDTFRQLTEESRLQLLGPGRRTVANPLGLFNALINDEVNVLGGSGLGGTSLINASIVLKPDLEVFWQPDWPAAFRDPSMLDPYYRRAEFNLGLTLTPFDQTPKMVSRRLAAERLPEGRYEISPINVTYDTRRLGPDGRNQHGMIQRPCTLCGDCITGCNIGAKNTLTTSYLPMAKAAGAEIYTQVEVETIEKLPSGLYRLHLLHHDNSGHEIVPCPVTVTTRLVVLGAGSPGSAEVLLRSAEMGLPLSPALGCHWSGNGDTIGFAINSEVPSHIGGFGAREPAGRVAGPTVQTTIDFRHRPRLQDRVIIQDASLPKAVTRLFALLLRDPQLKNSATMLGMGHDGSQGRILLDRGRARIVWPGLKESAYRQMMFREFERLAAAHGGRYKRLRAFGDNLVTVHPLGGCRMHDDPALGVVNHLGQVYDGQAEGLREPTSQSPMVHRGLYVADASVIPTSLGVNPLITVSALAEFIAEKIAWDPQHRDLFAG